ncbi:MAG: biosynthetic-type acetolactate synthase large subunit [Spirochaetes bacterium]|nr:biosynthetic-type acetolactate synthase large subunit [Spirochaetota bacterium]
MKKMTGAEMIVEALRKEGVEYLFAYQGGVVIPIFDALAKQQDIKVIIPRHEQGAAHAADGYARVTGKVGVCLATSGPGATNLVTGIANAYMDSIPMVAITGQVATMMIGNDAFQEADLTGITRTITKHNYLVRDVKDLPRILKEAFYIARTGRPGPVLVDMPADVVKAALTQEYPETVDIRSYKPNYKGHPRQIKQAAAMIMAAKRPVIMGGAGVIHAGGSDVLRAFVKKTGIPITTTLLGLGIYPTEDELFLGMPGMHGLFAANHALTESDLIISVGARFDDRVTGKLESFAPHAKVIHIDIDPTSVSKSVAVDIPIIGDAKMVLDELITDVSACDIGEWKARVMQWKKDNPLKYDHEGEIIKPQFVLETLSRIAPPDALVATDVGQHQMWTAQFYQFKHPRQLITSGGLGTMGFGLPAAIGAQLGSPEKKVLLISGDGSIQMNIQELATISNYDLPVKIIILNNHYLGMVRQWQELFFGKNYASTCLQKKTSCPPGCNSPTEDCPMYVPNFVKLADAYGIAAACVSKKSDVEAALKKALDHKGAYLLDVQTAREENVMPMVPAGQPINQMLLHGLA